MNFDKPNFVVITLIVVGAALGAIFGFWTTLGMIISYLLLSLAYRLYKGDKLKDEHPATIDA